MAPCRSPAGDLSQREAAGRAPPVSRPPRDETAGEVEHCEVGVGSFLPAHEDAAEAVEPGLGALDDPAAGAEAGLALERLRFLAARADVGSEAELPGELVHLGEVVALVQQETLGLRARRLRPLDRDRLERRAGELEVVYVRTRWCDAERDACALREEAALRPFLALSVGLGPVCSPPSGALPSAPSIASHSHSIPCPAS
jgi:hypothetical protein